MAQLDNKIVKEMLEEIEDSVLLDEYGDIINSFVDLETDKDIVDKVNGGNHNERRNY